MLNNLIISGGCLRKDGFELGEGKYYGEAKLIRLDLSTGIFSELLSLAEGNSNYPNEHPNLQFTAGCLDDDVLWLPTDTEVRKYQLPNFDLLEIYSHPCFHNIHSVYVNEDQLVVTSTGIDNVIFLNKHSGVVNGILNAEGKQPWHRFKQDVDYRKTHSTRPHDSHPNYIFSLNNELWVTRCTQEDAVNLSDVSQRIDISGSDSISVHDGILWRDNIVFTRVDGFLVVASQETKEVIQVIDPFANNKNRPVGWCRGIFVEGDIFYIGYSKLRKTKLKEKLKYLAKGNLKFSKGSNAMVVAFNIRTKTVLKVYETPNGIIDAIYSIMHFNYD